MSLGEWGGFGRMWIAVIIAYFVAILPLIPLMWWPTSGHYLTRIALSMLLYLILHIYTLEAGKVSNPILQGKGTETRSVPKVELEAYREWIISTEKAWKKRIESYDIKES